jgi:uncharacterized protein (DUF983 family)
MAETVPLERPQLRTLIARALWLRCPRCGAGRLYARGLSMLERCPACGLRYEREQGYFVGAIYVNYAITTVVVLGGVLSLDELFGLSLAAQLGIAVPLALLLPLLVHRHARSLWLAVGYLAGSLDERAERAARRGRRLPGG